MNRQVTTLPVTEKSVGNGNWDMSRAPIDRIVIHTMVGTAISADARFNNTTSKVSTQYGVLLDGSIWHWVDEDNTAYHSGDYAMNQRSISIEHEDNGDYDGVRPDALYTTSAKLVKDICQFYAIPIDRTHILKHSEVTATGCPDALDIDRIVREANTQPGNTCPQDRDENWRMVVQMFTTLGVPLDSNDKKGSLTKVLAKLDDILWVYTTRTTPSPPPSTVPPVATIDYKKYINDIRKVANESDPWWNIFVTDDRFTAIKAILNEEAMAEDR